MSNIGCLTSIFNLFLHLSVKYNRLKSEGRTADTVYFGVYSIIASVFSAGLFVLIAWGLTAMLGAVDSAGIGVILMYVFIAILALLLLVVLTEFVVGGLMGVVYQFRCNRKPISYAALVVYIVAAAGMIVGTVLILNGMSA